MTSVRRTTNATDLVPHDPTTDRADDRSQGNVLRGGLAGTVSTVAAILKGIVNGPLRERETLRSPLSGVHELRGGLREPLRYAHGEGHICDPRGPKISQPARRATDLLREFGPGQVLFLAPLSERGM